MTMRTIPSRIALTLSILLLASALLAAPPAALAPGEARYVITLTAGAHAPDLAALGGRLEATDGATMTVVLPAQSAKALAGDPAVRSMTEAAPDATAATSRRPAPDRLRLTPQDAVVLWGSGQYVYDGAGNITAMGTTTAPNGDGKTGTFTYDLASRLTYASIGRASGGDIVENYSYDGFGNLVTHQRTLPSAITYSPLPSLANNRMTESGVQYDNGSSTGPGNVTAIGGNTLTYDAFNQVTTKSATGSSTPDYTYIYDVNEERIGIQQAATTHWTIRDFDNKPLIAFDSPPASQTQSTWTWVESFVWAGQTMLMAERPNIGPLHYHVDHLGSTRVITDANGQLIAGSRVDLAPFGEEITTPNTEVIKFTGHERDYDLSNPTADTYLDYMHARYYDSRRGRFLSPDPVLGDSTDPQSWNRYAYTSNNPIVRTDPTGQATRANGYGWVTLAAHFIADPVGATKDAAKSFVHYDQAKEAVKGMTDPSASATEVLEAEATLVIITADIGAGFVQPEESSVEKVVTEQIPELIYRGGGSNPRNFAPSADGMVSTRGTLSNPWPCDPLKAPLPATKDIQVIETAKLPKGSVVPDGAPYGPQPEGHVSIGPNVPPATIKAALKKPIKMPK
jgi:RHS repeat-associated protein